MNVDIDLVILDWMLPDGSGIDLLKIWRKNGLDNPVLLLTARNETIDKVLGFELGADDYVTKPFDPRELLARIKARIRGGRAQNQASSQAISCNGITMNVEEHLVTFNGVPVELTKMEFQLLRLFLENPNRAFSRDEILNKVWGLDSFPTTRTIDTHVLQLRQKFASELFETIRGIGYRIVAAKDLPKPDNILSKS
jgi:DNA-binding response OmpR family regulator